MILWPLVDQIKITGERCYEFLVNIEIRVLMPGKSTLVLNIYEVSGSRAVNRQPIDLQVQRKGC